MGMIKENVVNALERCPRLPFDLCYAECTDCDCPYYDESGIKKLHQDVLALLKEQEAVKPTWSRGKPFCGACGLRIHGGKFCSECGKPILWEGR